MEIDQRAHDAGGWNDRPFWYIKRSGFLATFILGADDDPDT